MSGIKRGILTQRRHKRLLAFVMAVLISILSVPVYSGEIKVKAADARPNFQFKSKEYVSDKPTDVNVDFGHVYYPNEGTGPFPVLILVHGSGGYSTSGYVNQIVKWIRHGEVSPMVIITPNLQKTRYWQEFVHCNNKNIGGERELLGDLIKRIENGTYDSLTGVKLDKENISLCGWSMGGGTAIYGGCYYNDKIVNIGALSPTPYVHTNWSLYGGTDWLDNDEKTKDHKFTTRADKHLFLAASETEGNPGGEHYATVEYCYSDFGEREGLATLTFKSGKHDTELFLWEMYAFFHYVEHGTIPTNTQINDAMKVLGDPYGQNTIPEQTTRIPSGSSVTPTAKPTTAPTAKPTVAPTTPPTEALTGRVDIVGEAYCGKALFASVNGCNAKASDLQYQWKRNGIAISNANRNNYLLQKEDIGKIISCEVTDKSGTYSGSITGKTSQEIAPAPTAAPTAAPTTKPTAAPTAKPTSAPTTKPTAAPTTKPTAAPTAKPTAVPTTKPTAAPTAKPTAVPTTKPTAAPTVKPTTKPTSAPTTKPTAAPTAKPTAAPTTAPGANVTTIFADVQAGKWFVGAVQFVYEHQIMVGKGMDPKGSGKQIFDPNANLTRGEFATLLYNLEGKPDVTYLGTFTDVPERAYYAKPIQWLYNNGIAAGVGNGLFRPNENITREQIAMILYSYTKYKGGNMTADASLLERFSDVDKISSWAKEAMAWAVTQKVINGTGEANPKLNPKQPALRSECAAIIKNYLE